MGFGFFTSFISCVYTQLGITKNIPNSLVILDLLIFNTFISFSHHVRCVRLRSIGLFIPFWSRFNKLNFSRQFYLPKKMRQNVMMAFFHLYLRIFIELLDKFFAGLHFLSSKKMCQLMC